MLRQVLVFYSKESDMAPVLNWFANNIRFCH